MGNIKINMWFYRLYIVYEFIVGLFMALAQLLNVLRGIYESNICYKSALAYHKFLADKPLNTIELNKIQIFGVE